MNTLYIWWEIKMFHASHLINVLSIIIIIIIYNVPMFFIFYEKFVKHSVKCQDNKYFLTYFMHRLIHKLNVIDERI